MDQIRSQLADLSTRLSELIATSERTKARIEAHDENLHRFWNTYYPPPEHTARIDTLERDVRDLKERFDSLHNTVNAGFSEMKTLINTSDREMKEMFHRTDKGLSVLNAKNVTGGALGGAIMSFLYSVAKSIGWIAM